MTRADGGAAFPARPEGNRTSGMSLRDWFAGQVLISMHKFEATEEGMAQRAYAIADAMLAERGEE